MTKRVWPEPKAPGGKTPSNKAVEKRPDAAAETRARGAAWSVPIAVAEVPETGRHVELVPDEATRQAIAEEAGLVALPRVVATFDLARRGADSVQVDGRVTATVVQHCVVTLEPVESQIDELVELVFQPKSAGEAEGTDGEGFRALDGEEPPETLVNGTVDLGEVATEFLILGIDPYPRKDGAAFDAPPAGDPASHPFAALAVLKKDPKPDGG